MGTAEAVGSKDLSSNTKTEGALLNTLNVCSVFYVYFELVYYACPVCMMHMILNLFTLIVERPEVLLCPGRGQL